MPKNAISLFYGVNLRCFVPIFSKKLEKCEKKNAPKGPPAPPDPPKHIFLLREDVFLATNAKKRHKFVLWGQPKVFRTHFQQKTRKMCEKTPPGGPPAPPEPPKCIFLLGGDVF